MIEGNVGAGKSTFLKILNQHLQNIEIIFEPTKKWQNQDDDNNLLNLFYKDTRRWAYTFQSYAFISRIQSILAHEAKPSSKEIRFLERSVYCDRYCFAKNCYDAGLMAPLEWQIYKEWFSWLVENYTPLPSGFIYLRTNPKTCYQRVLKRHRHEESSISLYYLQALHDRHEDWLVHQKEVMPHLQSIPVLTLDCDKEFEADQQVQKRHIETIKSFIEQKVITQVVTNLKKSVKSKTIYYN
jgi:deoxyadenosine/deoxycytidine kinase